jgi:hypothetical protein
MPARSILSLMDLELHPSIILLDRTWNILVAPLPMLTGALNQHLDLQRFKGLFICGNYPWLLSSPARRFIDLELDYKLVCQIVEELKREGRLELL